MFTQSHRGKIVLLLSLVIVLSAVKASAQSTSFTYQGRLTDGGTAANGTYDLQFQLVDGGGNPQGAPNPNTLTGVPVINGVFTVILDFGTNGFPGADRFLQISVKHPADLTYTVLAPQQQITGAPYALRSLSASSADIAGNATALGGMAANQFVTTGDPRLSDSRPPTPGNSNYIQNTAAPQLGSNFNITGNGTVGGTVSGNAINSATQYNLGGNRVLSASGSNTFLGLGVAPGNTGFSNSFFGNGAGFANTSGANNSFFGSNAGSVNTGDPSNQSLAGGNSFFGSNAGLNNTLGFTNSFLGNSAGNKNTTGAGNTFVGSGAGFLNTDGSNNTYLGSDAGGSPSLFNATAIGAGASVTTSNTMVLGTGSVTVQVPGNLAVTGTLSGNGQNLTNLNAGNLATGIVPIANGGTGSATQNFVDLSTIQTIGGVKTFSNAVDSQAAYLIQGTRVLASGLQNTLVGEFADPLFNGTSNTLVGFQTGLQLDLASNNNSFFGVDAGLRTTLGNRNTFVGSEAGARNASGSRNSTFGYGADVMSDLVNATAIGANAQAGQNNSLVLGSINGLNSATADVNVGIGTTTPASRLDIGVNGTHILLGDAGCFPGLAGLGFGTSLSGCANYSLIGDGHDTIINRPSGGSVIFREGNTTQVAIAPGGLLTISNLGAAGSATLCRNVFGQVASCSSSLRYKKDLAPFRGGLNLLNRLHPITFTWKDHPERDLGLAAEDVARIDPLLVTHNAAGQIEGVKYDRINLILINAIKEQQTQIQEQQKRLAEQKAVAIKQQNEITQQQNLVNDLRKLVCLSHPHARACH